jgi:hypothetical protein
MEQGNTTSFEMKNDLSNRIVLRPETAITMLRVILFYAILFVAVSVFTN